MIASYVNTHEMVSAFILRLPEARSWQAADEHYTVTAWGTALLVNNLVVLERRRLATDASHRADGGELVSWIASDEATTRSVRNSLHREPLASIVIRSMPHNRTGGAGVLLLDLLEAALALGNPEAFLDLRNHPPSAPSDAPGAPQVAPGYVRVWDQPGDYSKTVPRTLWRDGARRVLPCVFADGLATAGLDAIYADDWRTRYMRYNLEADAKINATLEHRRTTTPLERLKNLTTTGVKGLPGVGAGGASQPVAAKGKSHGR